MITVQGIEKRYGELRAIADISFSIDRGEIVGLLGQNGAGKTTCMKMITGYLEPTAGHITIDGLDVIRQRTAAQAKIGYLPENNPLYPDMSVEEYLQFMAELRCIPRAKRAQMIQDALTSTGIRERRHQEIRTLSKGYRQRVGLAQAILHQPSILILDEPTNGLDPLQIQEIRLLIKRLAQNTTIFLSTHILSEIEAVCDRVVILIDGELAADHSLDELMNRPEIRVSVRGDESAEHALLTIDEVESLEPLGEDESGFSSYLIHYDGEASSNEVISKIARLIVHSGWEIGELSAHTQSLESAFREVQKAHATHRSLNDADSL